MKPAAESATRVQVWGVPVRVFHWTLVTCIVVDYFVLTDGKDLHRWLGYSTSALIARVRALPEGT